MSLVTDSTKTPHNGLAPLYSFSPPELGIIGPTCLGVGGGLVDCICLYLG